LPAIEVNHVTKSFGKVKAVDDVSFFVVEGEVFGLLGPNGAGKTTTIRLALDIFRPDSGEISVLGGKMTEAKKNRIGYMPEERGLYQDVALETVLIYLANLKGLETRLARQRVGEYLERFDLAAYRRKKVKDLSKGMQQKAQIIATLAHQPELLIVDEPFSGLDPLNTQLVKDILLDLQKRGVTIVMSTHQMHQVEEMCTRLLLVNRGRAVLYGSLKEIQNQFAENAILLQTPQAPPDLPGVEAVEKHNTGWRLRLAPGVAPNSVLEALVAGGAVIERFEIAAPSLDEIFVRVVKGEPRSQ
jgi:ABC-2 type transport system ATP-binding protein